MTWEILLAIIIPSAVVFLAVYFTFKQYHQHEMRTQLLDSKKVKDQITLPMKLQAFERLLLLCERIDLAELVLRLKTPGTTAKELQSAMLIAIQQEFEHNLTQQLYVSAELWQVLLAAKSKTMDLIMMAGNDLNGNATSDDFAIKLFESLSSESNLPSLIGKKAVKTEASLWL